MKLLKRTLSAIALGLAAVLPMAAGAQSFPDKPVRVLMPFPPGTGPDTVMRIVGEKLTQKWKQTVVIENRPGGNAFIAMTAAKRSPADGYTFVLVDYGNVTVLPHLFPKTIPFDPKNDFEAVAPMYWAYWFVAIPADSKFKGVSDLVAEAKAKNGAYTYGSSGTGSPMHLQAAMLENASGTRMTHIPYKETPQIITDISRNEIGWAFTTGATGGAMVKAGKVRFLAVASPQRHPAFPDVPTLAEAGGPADFDLRTWVALYAPRGVPKQIVEKVNADVAAVLSEPDVRNQLQSMGLEPWVGAPSVLVKQQESDLKKYGELTGRLKISLD